MADSDQIPEESMKVIRAAYEEYVKRYPTDRTMKENFLNGFIFGMQFGLTGALIPPEVRRSIMIQFLGESPDAQP